MGVAVDLFDLLTRRARGATPLAEGEAMSDDSVFYFAYGSNADPERFTARVGAWRSRCAGRLEGHRLRFASSVQSEDGGGAVVDALPGGIVDGVVYEIGADQRTAMDREEFREDRDTARLGRRVRHTIVTDTGSIEAELYTVADDDEGWHPPSARYLGHILVGLEAAGHGPEALERVRHAAREASARADRTPSG